VEALLIDDVTRRSYLERSGRVRRLFAAILPDPAASVWVRTVGVARNLAETIRSLDPAPDVSHISGAVQDLLDRSVGAEEYVIRAAGGESHEASLVDLNTIDFDALAARLAEHKRTSGQQLAGRLRGRVEAAARRNPTRVDLVERIHELIEQYNAGSLNVDEMLRRLMSISRGLSEEEERTVREGLGEAELAVFDLLTRPDPELSEAERDQVKLIARKLMSQIEERLVLDWRRKAETREAARVLVKDVLDELPDAYEPEVWERKTEVVFNHIFASYYDDGTSVYDETEAAEGSVVTVDPQLPTDAETAIDVERVSASELAEKMSNPEFAALVAEQLRGDDAFFAIASDELIASDENHRVEFKATARWNLVEERKDKRMEGAVVKTVAGLLNTDGGTLFIGVDDDRAPIGLGQDLPLVKPPNADGLVNWLTTHLINALTHTPVMRTRARIDVIDGSEVCRVDIARSSAPVTARMSDGREAFWVRMNNSTRELPEVEQDVYVRDHWAE
ncbi:MAG: type I restriction enzyme endonuclease domain-containing protein, partial [Solirubrobacterales bacterium]